MTAYLLQTLCFQLLFLLAYELLFKKETLFAANRFYLLFTALASLLLPFARIEALDIYSPEESLLGISNVWLPEIFIGSTPDPIQSLPAVELTQQKAQLNWWLLMYGAGLACGLGLLFRKLRHLRKLFSHPVIRREKNFRIIEIPGSKLACTFHNTIFLGAALTEKEKQHILPHEIVHVTRKHSLDLVFFELLKLIFWFNPLIYVYQRKISSVHEFQADAAVVKQVHRTAYYQQLLNQVFDTNSISFINQFFNHSLIKKRIVMLQKSKSHAQAPLKYLVILPLMLLMLTYVACSPEEEQPKMSEDSVAEHLEFIKTKVQNGEELSSADFKKLQELYRMVNQQQGKTVTASEIIEVDPESAVPYLLVDTPPSFSNCAGLSERKEKKDCFVQTLSTFVNEEFDTGIAKKLELEGMNKIYVQFTIDETGRVSELRARAPHPELEAEALRVVGSLPQMKPASHEGKTVSMIYSLPITINLD